MEDKTLALLDKHGALILPEEIEHSTYVLLLEALLHVGGKPLVLYCRGNGGSSRSAAAMVDLIRQHGNVTGLLPGEANSSHGIVFASCQQRYIYPHARLGIHQVSWDGLSTRIDNPTLKLIARDYRMSDTANAAILSDASNRSPEWWLKMIKKAGSGGIIHFHAPELREMELARPIEEYPSKKAEVL